MSTINITPFTDVLLVLLIIFIILASVTKEPPLPLARNAQTVVPSQIVVEINKDNEVLVGSRKLTETDAPEAFHELVLSTGGHLKSVIIKADPRAHYGTILRVMDAAKQENLTEFGLANKVEK